MGQAGVGQTCGNCGTVNSPGEQFCINCGYTLTGLPTGPTTTAQPAAPQMLGAYGSRRITGSLPPSSLLGGRYRVVQLVGKGGFGAVYKARDERFQATRAVAIKEMSDATLSPSERTKAIEEFRQESNLLVQLNHPNLPNVSDFFEEGGKAYLVMEFIEGKTLETVQEDAGRPLGEALVMGWAMQLCDVLTYLHTLSQPIIFRDMKPPNAMVTQNNQIKLIDFGIARVFKVAAKKDTTLLGSQGYAPLEQYGRGQSDARSDIYALGATLYDLLTNEVPADAPTRRINPGVFQTPRQLNPQLTQATENILLKAMEQDPDDRYQTAAAMLQDIVQSGVAPVPPGLYTSGTLPAAPQQVLPPRPAASVPRQGGVGPSGSTVSRSQNVRPVVPPPQQVFAPSPPLAPPSPVARRTVLIGGAALVVAALAGTGVFLATKKSGSGGGTGSVPTQPAAGTLTLNFTYSTEKAAWIQASIDAFNKQGMRLANKVIQVVQDPRGSGDAKDKILNGALKPVIWSPASFLELSQLSAAWQLAHAGKDIVGSGELLPKSLVFSPLVFAVWEQRAQVLQKKYGTIDWPSIHDALILKNGWADIGGDAAWGLVKFGQTRPDQSNSALLAITLLAYSFYKQERGLTVKQVQDAKFLQYLSDVQGAVNAFGRSSGTFLENVVILQGPAAYDVTITYENLVLTLGETAKNRQKQALQRYYPSVNIVSDHPFAILQGEWVKPEEQQAARVFRDFLLADEQQRLALKSGFRPTSPNVQLTDSVSGNVFTRQSSTGAIPPQIQRLAQSPGGGVVDELVKQWKDKYNDTSTTPGG